MAQDPKLEHRLAAIMATDVVGYSRLIQSDEAGTLAALGTIRAALTPAAPPFASQLQNGQGRIEL
jgi:class 3 adenylate cyclase